MAVIREYRSVYYRVCALFLLAFGGGLASLGVATWASGSPAIHVLDGKVKALDQKGVWLQKDDRFFHIDPALGSKLSSCSPGRSVRLEYYKAPIFPDYHVYSLSLVRSGQEKLLARQSDPPRFWILVGGVLVAAGAFFLFWFLLFAFPRRTRGRIGAKSGPFQGEGQDTTYGITVGERGFLLLSRKHWEELAVGDQVELRYAAFPPYVSRISVIAE